MSCNLNMFLAKIFCWQFAPRPRGETKNGDAWPSTKATKGVSISVSEPRHAPKLIKSVEAESEKLCRESAEEKKIEFVGFQTF